jgi:urease accessory protein
VCLVTFGGGLVDGDDLEVDIEVERGATLVVFTQASTKVFRGSSRQCLRARVAGTLVVLLDPVACFAGARYEQRTEIALEDDGACVVLDGFTSGRPAYGERWRMDGLLMRTRVTRGATRLLDDAVRLDARDAPIAERMQGFDAFLTVSAVGASAAPVCAALLARAGHGPSSRGERAALVAPNALPSGGALVRIASASPEVALAEARHRLRNLPDIDAVDTFGARR